VAAADLLRLGPTHAIRVDGSDDGPRASPVVLDRGSWRPATAGDGVGVALLRRLYAGAPLPDRFRISTPDRPPGPIAAASFERAMGVDQTHDSWVVGGDVVVKWMTGPLVGPHPAGGRLRRLSAAGFAESPQLWGMVEWRDDAGDWIPVVIAQSYLSGADDGWTWAVGEARRALRIDDGQAQDFAGDLGEVVGRMHLALADEPPTRLSAALARQHADEALLALDRAVRLLEPHDAESHALLLAHRSEIEGVLAGLAEAEGAAVLPVHGDLHVGQVLRGPGGYAVVDFDGNPTRSPALRAEEAPAAMDVADMLVSLENVSHVARHYAPADLDATAGAALDWTATAWTGHAQGLFLSGYRRALGDRLDLFDAALVPAYSWEQVCREFVYALTHDLLEWLYVPAASLRRRLEEG
jgi:maltokinase